jgi:hypothetical protein
MDAEDGLFDNSRLGPVIIDSRAKLSRQQFRRRRVGHENIAQLDQFA